MTVYQKTDCIMRHFILLFIGIMITSCGVTAQDNAKSQHSPNSEKPRIIILATGGTIAGSGESSTESAYKAGQLPVDDLLKAVPEIHEYAEIKGEQIANIGSQDMDTETWLKLSNRINEIFEKDQADGVIVTHGTDTMEETAYFTSLTVQADNPVVFVGAMRPSTALSQDGNRNLLDAIAVASSPKSKDIGIVTVMNEFIIAARAVDKTSTTNTSAFQSLNHGPLGVIYNGKPEYFTKSLRSPKTVFDVTELESLPNVDILYGYAGAEPEKVDVSVKYGALGIVYAGVGNGNFSSEVEEALAKAVNEGIAVVRSSRIQRGRVTLDNEIDDEARGFIVSDDLSPQKARILLMLALTQTHDREKIQEWFFSY